MKHKLLKKILGVLNYKIVDKTYFKNTRVISGNSSFNTENLIKELFKNKLKKIIQIGANDGKRFDILNKFIKKNKTNSILIEPIKKNYLELKKNYQKCDYVQLENSAISVNNEINYLYKVNEKFLKYYDNHIPGITSFKKNHLINHGVSKSHISREKVNCLSIKKLFNKYKIKKIDLLFIDAEGYDGNILLDFFKMKKFFPIIIFEYIHIDNNVLKKVIDKLKKNKYKFFMVNENVICLPKNKSIVI